MIRSKTTFIVGAGASCEVGLPTSGTLAKTISAKVNIRYRHGNDQQSGDHGIAEALSLYAKSIAAKPMITYDINLFLHEGWKMAVGLPQALSIDNYLDAHNGNAALELVGKLAIAQTILEAERSSQLYTTHHNTLVFDFGKVEQTWFARFAQILGEGRRKSDLLDYFANVVVITFNYDRCIEHFLFNAIRDYYALTEEEAREVMRPLKVWHPYGVVAPLPWQEPKGHLEFGAKPSAAQLLAASQCIKTFAERLEDEESLAQMRNSVHSSAHLVFLGFAFHPQNLELLKATEKSKVRRIYATAHGISDGDVEFLIPQLRRFLGVKDDPPSQIRNNLKCNDLFLEFGRALRS